MLNLTILEGEIARPPELKHTKGNVPVCSFTIETEQDNSSDYIICVAFGDNAIRLRHSQAGDWIAVAGRLRSRVWTDRRGETRMATEVYVHKFLEPGEIKLEQIIAEELKPVFTEINDTGELPF